MLYKAWYKLLPWSKYRKIISINFVFTLHYSNKNTFAGLNWVLGCMILKIIVSIFTKIFTFINEIILNNGKYYCLGGSSRLGQNPHFYWKKVLKASLLKNNHQNKHNLKFVFFPLIALMIGSILSPSVFSSYQAIWKGDSWMTINLI